MWDHGFRGQGKGGASQKSIGTIPNVAMRTRRLVWVIITYPCVPEHIFNAVSKVGGSFNINII